MHFTLSTIVLVATVLLGGVLAGPIVERSLGGWRVNNNFGKTIYYTAVTSQGTLDSSSIPTGSSATGQFAPDSVGLSMKMCSTSGCTNPYQCEMTYKSANNAVFYDQDATAGDPFLSVKRSVGPSQGSSGPTFTCAAGVSNDSCEVKDASSTAYGTTTPSATVICQIG